MKKRFYVPARTAVPLLTAGLLAIASHGQAQTTASAGAGGTAPSTGAAPAGSTVNTFLDLAQASSWSAGLPNSTTEAILSGGRVGTTANLSVQKLSLGVTELFGGAYGTAVNYATGLKTVTVGAGGVSVSGTTDTARVAGNVTLVLAANQDWNIASSRTLNLVGSVSGSHIITLTGPGTVSARNTTANHSFTGQWNVTAGQLRLAEAATVGSGAVNVAISNNASHRLLNAVAYPHPISIGTGGGQLLTSVAGVVMSGNLSGTDKLTVGATAVSCSMTLRNDMSTHVGAIELARGFSGLTVNFGSGTDPLVNRAKVSIAPGLNGIADGINTSVGSSAALIRGGTGANAVTANFTNAVFNIDITGADATDGNQWRLVDVDNLTESFGANFAVELNGGALTESANVWTKINPGKTWTFDEATGILSVADNAFGNQAPTDISLTSQSLTEGNAIGAAVGSLSTVDAPGDTFTYSLVAGAGSTDNDSFSISGNSLQAGEVFDFDTKSSYSVRIRTTDQGGLSTEEAFTISILRPVIATTGTSLDLSLAETWTGGVVPGAGDIAKFAHPGIYFAPAASDFTWAGIQSEAAGLFEINPASSGNAYTIHLGPGGISGSQNIDRLGGGLVVDVGTDNQTWNTEVGNVQCVIAGSATVTYTSPSRLWLRGSNTFTGNWRADGGTIHPDANANWSATAGATAQLINNGILRLSNSAYNRVRIEMIGDGRLQGGGTASILNRGSGTDTGDLFGPGNLTVTGSVTLNGDVRHTGNTSVNAGVTLSLGTAGVMTFTPGANGISNNLRPGTAGAAQVETANAAGIVTGDGDASVVITANGSSIATLAVPLLSGDNAASWADKVRTALSANTAVTDLFTVGGSGAAITLTSKAVDGAFPANDSTLNISLTNGTSIGITPASTSANTTVGGATALVALDGQFAIDTSTADLTAGNSWTLVQVASLGETYGGSFAVSGYTETSPGVWTREDYGHTFTFTETSGVLTVVDNALVNVEPTDIALAPSTIVENNAIGALVGAFSTTDNAKDTFTYTLVSGSGSADNASFSISGGGLVAAQSFDFETKPSYSIRIRSTDQGGLFTEKSFTVAVSDLPDTGFSGWITGTFGSGSVPSGQQGENDDPDQDGISNLLEYAIDGGDPTVGNASIGTFNGTTVSFSKRQPLAGDLTYTIEQSTDLGADDLWSPVTPSVNSSTTISYTLPGGQAKDFVRLKVTRP